MKSEIFILCSAAAMLMIFPSASACGPDCFYPEDYMMPRIYDTTYKSESPSQSLKLMEDWKAIVSSRKVSVEDIEDVVFNYSVSEVKEIMKSDRSYNSFANWIFENARKDIVQYLVLAKNCERTRSLYNSRWYYPSKRDGVEMTLEDIRDISIKNANRGGQLAPRYALQAIRAMITLNDYRGIVDFWKKIESAVPSGVIRNMCAGYVSRAKFEHGLHEEAIKEYMSAGDISSVEFCLKRMGKDCSTLELLESVAKYDPNNDYAPKTLQKWFDFKVMFGYNFGFFLSGERTTWYERMTEQIIPSKEADSICMICDIAVENKDCRNPAMWLYCKALALDLSGRAFDAKKVNNLAWNAVGTDFIRNSVHVMKIWLDAKTANYDNAYKLRLLQDLRWLDQMIEKNLTEEVINITTDMPFFLTENRSYYYWNDMLKKILLGQVCPKLIEEGDEVLAIRLANMADNRLIKLVGSQFRTDITSFNKYDYCNGLFHLINKEVKPSSIEKYVASINNPTGLMDNFLDSCSYLDKSYFLDVAGTRYIRERNYAKAVKVLEKVPSAYQYRLNTAGYMNRDPFLLERNKQLFIYPDYKLNFARRMAEYERIITGDFGPDEKGRAKIRMGVGINASQSFAWALADYSYSPFSNDTDMAEYSYTPFSNNTDKNFFDPFKLIRQGLDMIENREVKAQELLFLHKRLEVVKNYAGTMASKDILRHCDEYNDYL